MLTWLYKNRFFFLGCGGGNTNGIVTISNKPWCLNDKMFHFSDMLFQAHFIVSICLSISAVSLALYCRLVEKKPLQAKHVWILLLSEIPILFIFLVMSLWK
ncbi:MAG: hypothetical protein UX04_C0002G0263 [Microgenomates group bacterium GW2011_GWF2_45_18]|nr:MAG: hypothetical protein UW18_C0003G0299 [Microgenomates group bacterium GW2011_GWF1_44_10]KKU02120.1 MAG: hypothetical protein UX04_C0002G0263 [Microgenomates group bacterium GW2011_GWF2_45_18]